MKNLILILALVSPLSMAHYFDGKNILDTFTPKNSSILLSEIADDCFYDDLAASLDGEELERYNREDETQRRFIDWAIDSEILYIYLDGFELEFSDYNNDDELQPSEWLGYYDHANHFLLKDSDGQFHTLECYSTPRYHD